MDNVIKNVEFKEIMEQTIEDIVHFLLYESQSFGVLCNLSKIVFEPSLPDEILKSFKPFTFFILANYTLQTAKIEDDYLIFEAGFGENDFSSVVKVPLFAIFQIVINDNVIFLNLSATVEEFEAPALEDEDKSVNALLSNPENMELLKKLKK